MTPAPDFPEPAGERRRRSYPTLSPSAILAELSALVILEQLTAPALVVELRHRDGSTVRAHMSGSALPRDDDPFALVIFHDLTEQLWGKH